MISNKWGLGVIVPPESVAEAAQDVGNAEAAQRARPLFVVDLPAELSADEVARSLGGVIALARSRLGTRRAWMRLKRPSTPFAVEVAGQRHIVSPVARLPRRDNGRRRYSSTKKGAAPAEDPTAMEVDEAVPPVQTEGGKSGGVPGSRKAAATDKKEKKPRKPTQQQTDAPPQTHISETLAQMARELSALRQEMKEEQRLRKEAEQKLQDFLAGADKEAGSEDGSDGHADSAANKGTKRRRGTFSLGSALSGFRRQL